MGGLENGWWKMLGWQWSEYGEYTGRAMDNGGFPHEADGRWSGSNVYAALASVSIRRSDSVSHGIRGIAS